MTLATRALRGFLGLFVDDGSFAIVLILWSALAAYFLPDLPINAGWDGPILFLGYLLILAENLHRTARRRT
jgi:hypothetical protein